MNDERMLAPTIRRRLLLLLLAPLSLLLLLGVVFDYAAGTTPVREAYDQAHRSRHHKAFLEPDAADVVLANDAKWLRDRWAANGVPAEAIEKHLSVLGDKATMEAALAWYRGRGAIRAPIGPIRVPRDRR